VAGLPLLTDNHIRQPIVKALLARGWDVLRAVDVLGEGNMMYWWAEHQREMSDGDIAEAIEELAAKPNAFGYPIEYIKPKR